MKEKVDMYVDEARRYQDLSPNEAIEKVVEKYAEDMSSELVGRIVEAYNVKTFMDKQASGFDMEESFPVADASTIVKKSLKKQAALILENLAGPPIERYQLGEVSWMEKEATSVSGGKITFPKSEIASLKLRDSFYTTRIGSDIGKYELGKEYETPWGKIVKVMDKKVLDDVKDHPFFVDLTKEQKREIANGKYEVIRLSVLGEQDDDDGYDIEEDNEKDAMQKLAMYKCSEYLSNIGNLGQDFISELRYLYPNSGILKIAGLSNGNKKVVKSSSPFHEEFSQIETLLQKMSFLKKKSAGQAPAPSLVLSLDNANKEIDKKKQDANKSLEISEWIKKDAPTKGPIRDTTELATIMKKVHPTTTHQDIDKFLTDFQQSEKFTISDTDKKKLTFYLDSYNKKLTDAYKMEKIPLSLASAPIKNMTEYNKQLEEFGANQDIKDLQDYATVNPAGIEHMPTKMTDLIDGSMFAKSRPMAESVDFYKKVHRLRGSLGGALGDHDILAGARQERATDQRNSEVLNFLKSQGLDVSDITTEQLEKLQGTIQTKLTKLNPTEEARRLYEIEKTRGTGGITEKYKSDVGAASQEADIAKFQENLRELVESQNLHIKPTSSDLKDVASLQAFLTKNKTTSEDAASDIFEKAKANTNFETSGFMDLAKFVNADDFARTVRSNWNEGRGLTLLRELSDAGGTAINWGRNNVAPFISKPLTEGVMGELSKAYTGSLGAAFAGESLNPVTAFFKQTDKQVMAGYKNHTLEMVDAITRKALFEGLLEKDEYLKNANPELLLRVYEDLIQVSPLASRSRELVRSVLRQANAMGRGGIDPETYQMLAKIEADISKAKYYISQEAGKQ